MLNCFSTNSSWLDSHSTICCHPNVTFSWPADYNQREYIQHSMRGLVHVQQINLIDFRLLTLNMTGCMSLCSSTYILYNVFYNICICNPAYQLPEFNKVILYYIILIMLYYIILLQRWCHEEWYISDDEQVMTVCGLSSNTFHKKSSSCHTDTRVATKRVSSLAKLYMPISDRMVPVTCWVMRIRLLWTYRLRLVCLVQHKWSLSGNV